MRSCFAVELMDHGTYLWPDGSIHEEAHFYDHHWEALAAMHKFGVRHASPMAIKVYTADEDGEVSSG